MADPTPMKVDGDWLPRVSEVSLRMMAGAIPKRTVERVRRLMAGEATAYPWQQVVDSVLADETDRHALLERGLTAQRDWFARGAAAGARVGRAARVAGKSVLAFLISRLVFLVAFSGMVVLLLVLAHQLWPAADIYRIPGWLKDVLGRAGR